MFIRKASYANMDWLKALEAQAKPKDPTKDLGEQNESDLISNALESTANVAFGTSIKTESGHEAVVRASKEIADKAADEIKLAAANDIKAKLAKIDIDPVALGCTVREPNGVQRPITKAEWEGASDARWVEKIATQAALAYEKQVKHAWEQNALKPAQHLSSKFDPTMARDGKIMSSTAANEETRGRPTQIPANAASIFDPFKLDRYAIADNEHDISKAGIRDAAKKREEEKKAELAPKDIGPDPMKGGQVIRAGGEDKDVFVQRSPKNQVSMLDTVGTEKMTPEQIKEALSKVFTRVEDNGEKIKAANKERKETIQGKQEKDRSWEQVQKPQSTSDMANRLMDALWPKEKE